MRQSGACVSSTVPPLGIAFWPFHPRQQLTAVMTSPSHLLDPSTPSPLPGACVPATAGRHAELLACLIPSCFAVCGHHLSPRIAIVLSLLSSVPNFSMSHSYIILYLLTTRGEGYHLEWTQRYIYYSYTFHDFPEQRMNPIQFRDLILVTNDWVQNTTAVVRSRKQKILISTVHVGYLSQGSDSHHYPYEYPPVSESEWDAFFSSRDLDGNKKAPADDNPACSFPRPPAAAAAAAWYHEVLAATPRDLLPCRRVSPLNSYCCRQHTIPSHPVTLHHIPPRSTRVRATTYDIRKNRPEKNRFSVP